MQMIDGENFFDNLSAACYIRNHQSEGIQTTIKKVFFFFFLH